MEVSFNENVFQDLLPIYYQRLFPFSLYYKWMKYDDDDKIFANREFSFTLKDDVYLRYQSFKDEADMRKQMLEKCPHKIDIGAVFSSRPSDQRIATAFHPVQKELVFDIDMTDYDEIRTCCSGTDICQKCWPFMVVAMKILNRSLKADFGFKHLLWVFSGRRGVHCWVCDKTARELSPSARSAIVEYLTLVKGGAFKTKKVQFPEILHPSIDEASKIIDHHFEDLVLNKQDILGTTERVEKISDLCLDNNVRSLIKTGLEDSKSSKEKWEKFNEIVDVALDKKGYRNKNKHFTKEVMFQLCYPRLDVNVSKGLNHLLKAPFCVHPKTGKVCVPIDIKQVDKFDPFKVPTISRLCEEINKYDAQIREDERNSQDLELGTQLKKVQDVSKTSLGKSIEVFETFLQKLISDF